MFLLQTSASRPLLAGTVMPALKSQTSKTQSDAANLRTTTLEDVGGHRAAVPMTKRRQSSGFYRPQFSSKPHSYFNSRAQRSP